MKIVFVSNYFNHHQSAVAECFAKTEGVEYTFIESGKMSESRKALGYEAQIPDYVVTNEKFLANPKLYKYLVDTADVVIIGGYYEAWIKTRLQKGKLTFVYSERLYKDGYEFYKFPVRLVRAYKQIIRYKNLYLLCASAYTAADYAKSFAFLHKAYKWGYFPEVKTLDVDGTIAEKEKNSIIWAGRFLDWKHPDDAISVLARLKAEGYEFVLRFIGMGELEDALKKQVAESGLSGNVQFLGSMKPEEVRIYMEKSQIALFTSDRREGWGAVLNEEMASGCAVVASHAAGSTPYLVKDKENGFIYKSGDKNALYKCVKALLDDQELIKAMGKNAYLTMSETWNAQNAVARFMELVQKLLNGEKSPEICKEGPCSKG